MRLVQYVEIDVDYCSLTYGAGACDARTELITNGTFATNIAGWSAGFSTCTAAWASGVLRLTRTGTDYASYQQGFATVIGQTYTATVSVAATNDVATIAKSDSATVPGTNREDLIYEATSPTTVSVTFVATASTTYIHCFCGGAGSVNDFDNISVVPGILSKKCFNSLATCQDRANFNNVPVTLRFSVDTGYNDPAIEAIPNVLDISLSPSRISLGRDLGIRSSVSVSFKDHRHSDTGEGFDKYLASRSYDPWEQGTFWGRFRSRFQFLRGRPLRIIRGELGQTLGEMETRHYVIESFSGPTIASEFMIVAKDVLKLADSIRAQAPAPSTGVLDAAITDSATSLTLDPVGVGALEYPASGHVNIGGREVCSFTRSGDVLTLTRAQYNTEAVAHAEGDRVQLCLEYVNEDPADIIYDLFVNYANISSALISLPSWQAETGAYLQRVYSTLITEPTGVDVLVSELIEQAALALWSDDVEQLIKLQVLREVPANSATYNDNNMVGGTLQVVEQPDERISQVWVYYARHNPLRPLTELSNYKQIYVNVNAQNEIDYDSSSIKRILSRWIPPLGSTTANRMSDIILARFNTPPRRLSFELMRTDQGIPSMGALHTVGSFILQDDEGAADLVPAQVISVQDKETGARIVAEELRFTGVELDDAGERTLVIDVDSDRINLRTLHDSIYPVITDPTGITVTCYINAGVTVGGDLWDTATPSFDVGSWVAGLTIEIVNLGRIQGRGARGGRIVGSSTVIDSEDGGVALYTRYPVTVNNQGEIWGGAGGGAGGRKTSGGVPQFLYPGGGAGTPPGIDSSFTNTDATTEAGGTATTGTGALSAWSSGAGGDPGENGYDESIPGSWDSGFAIAKGSAGAAVDGVSYVTFSTAGDRAGPEIN